MDDDLILVPQRTAPIPLFRGEDRTFAFVVASLADHQPIDIATVRELTFAMGLAGDDSVRRRLVGFTVQPDDVVGARPDIDSLDVEEALIKGPRHGLLSGDVLVFGDTAPQALRSQTCVAEVLSPTTFGLMTTTGHPIAKPEVLSPFTVSTGDVQLRPATGAFTVRLREHVTEALPVAVAQDVQVTVGWQDPTRVLEAKGLFDVYPQIGQGRV